MAKREQLCWSCIKCYGDCSWTEMTKDGVRFEPVPGWTARKSKMGYHVTACPKYEADESALQWEKSGRYEGCGNCKGATRAGSVPIKASNIKTGEVVRYSSVSEAVKRSGFRYDKIWACLGGDAKSHYGWKFERVGEQHE